VVKKKKAKHMLRVLKKEITDHYTITPLYISILCLPVGYLLGFWLSLLVRGMVVLEKTWRSKDTQRREKWTI